MAKERDRLWVRDAAALKEFRRMEELRREAAQAEKELVRLLGPMKGKLRQLVAKRDQLLYESLLAKQAFFQKAKEAYPELEDCRSARYLVRSGKVYVAWDDRGPHFLIGKTAELPQLHPFLRRRPGRRTWDVFFWPR